MAVRFTKAEVAAFFPDYIGAGDEMRVKQCPRCKRDKYKFYVNPYKGKTNCKHCNYSPRLEVLIGESSSRFRAFGLPTKEKDREKYPEPLPKSYPLDTIPMTHPVFGYIRERRFTPELFMSYGAKYCESGTHKRRILFPFYDNKGNYRGFQGRYIKDNSHKSIPKWRIGKNTKKRQMLFNFSRVFGNQDWCIVTEGIFDCLRTPDWSVALLGKKPSQYQSDLLEHFRYIYLAPDPDAYHEVKEIQHSIVRDAFMRVCVLRLEKGDPDDHTPEELKEILLSQRPGHFNSPKEIDL